MKNLTYYDKRHDRTIVVISPKSRKEAEKRIREKYLPKMFDWSTIEELNNLEEVIYETESTVL